jgi:hypothetical protein
MAIQTSFSTPLTATESIYTLLTALCTAGWVVPAWSDGTTYHDSVTNNGGAVWPRTVNPFGSASSGANGIGNTSAWFRVTAPDGSREWLFQRGAADVTWTVSRSRLGFTGGSPAAATLPTDATSGLAMLAATTLFPAVSNTHRWAISLETSAPYGWFAFLMPIGGGNIVTVLLDEPMSTVSVAPGDTDSVVSGLVANGAITALGALFSTGASAVFKVWKRMRHGLTGAANVRVSTLMYIDGAYVVVATVAGAAAPAQAVGSPYQVGCDPVAQTEFPLPIVVTMTAAPSVTTGYCGICNRLRWCTVAGRNNGQTLYDATNALYWIYAGGMWIPWDSSQPNI